MLEWETIDPRLRAFYLTQRRHYRGLVRSIEILLGLEPEEVKLQREVALLRERLAARET